MTVMRWLGAAALLLLLAPASSVFSQTTIPSTMTEETGECIECHAAHGSPHDNILKKGQPMLCLSCHKEVAQYWRDGVAHKPAVMNCMECHVAHGSDEQGMTNAGIAGLCSRCHETDTETFSAAHQNITPGKDSCTQCHDAHGSPAKGLLYPVGHTPFVEGNCVPCHKGGGRK